MIIFQVGTISLLSLTGLAVFILFFLAATLNAIIISLLMSVAAAGGFLAFFFGCLVTIYIGALSIAVVVISITTVATIIAVLVAAGIFQNSKFIVLFLAVLPGSICFIINL